MLRTLDEKVDPAAAALVVVDVQNDFCHDGGAFARMGRDVEPIRGMVPRLQELIDSARTAGVPVIFLAYTQSDATESDVLVEQRSRGRAGLPYCREGTFGVELYEVAPKPGEAVIAKRRYSGFVGTDLDVILRSTGRRTLVMTGIATNGCVEATARDGFMLDYYIVMVDDCCACYSADLHQATLTNCRDAWGVVATSDELMSIWGGVREAVGGSR
ncbi:MAG: cysteine hydrolase family protein [Actinomycetota bacterium]